MGKKEALKSGAGEGVDEKSFPTLEMQPKSAAGNHVVCVCVDHYSENALHCALSAFSLVSVLLQHRWFKGEGKVIFCYLLIHLLII